MSLLVFSSSNKLAQGIIKKIYASGTFERLVCADLYPNYWAIERFLHFRSELDSVSSKTELVDIKIGERSDLLKAIRKSSHVLYITHDYYSLTSSKLNLIKTTAQLSKNQVQKLVCLTPVEYDHYGEKNPALNATNSEKQAKEANPELVHLKCDLTFGEHSGVANQILKRIINEKNICYKPLSHDQEASPIHSDDVAKAVELAFSDKVSKGASVLLQGSSRVTIGNFLSTLQKHAGKSININTALVEKLFCPANKGLISEKLYTPEYRNLVGLLSNYKTLEKQGFTDTQSLGLKLTTLEETYKEKGIDESKYRCKDGSCTENWIKHQVY